MGFYSSYGAMCLLFWLSCTVAELPEQNLRKTPPFGKTGDPVTVNATMYILDIGDVNEKTMEFTMQFYFRQQWRDERLKFEGTENKLLRDDELNEIWKPDLFFVGEHGGKLHTLTVPNIFTRLSPDGTILHSMRMTMVFRCVMDLRYYPHDTQTCAFDIESYGYTAKMVRLSWAKNGTIPAVGRYETPELPDFNVLNVDYDEEVIAFSTGIYSRLTVAVTFGRKIGFFLTKMFVPYILLVATSWLAFWIKPNFVVQRLSLLLAILFLMVVLSMDLNTHIPPVSYTKGIDVWTSFCLSLVFAAFLESLFVSTFARNNKHQSEDDKTVIVSGLDLGNDETKTEKKHFQIGRKCNLRRILHSKSRIDLQLRIVYPIVFGVFNVIYWSHYAA